MCVPGKLEGFLRASLGLRLAVHEFPEAVVVRVVRAAAANLQLVHRHHRLVAHRVSRLRTRLLLVTLWLQDNMIPFVLILVFLSF